MLDETQPTRPLDHLQTLRIKSATLRRSKRIWLFMFAALLLYFFAPLRTNILLLGADDSPARGVVGRTDTIILATTVPTLPYVGMLSIPRDLWVMVPDIGEQRINTAYFFAEANESGSGGKAAARTIRENFGVSVHYYAVIHMLGLVTAVEALGGIEIRLEAPMGGLPAGSYLMNGDQALAFVRERQSGDDFGRMQRTQILIAALFQKALQPSAWPALPRFVLSLMEVIETNIPLWQWPRLLFAFLRSFLFGIDSRVVTREMVVPFTTSGGAQVLAPNWDALDPMLQEMFGK
jgi:polyisoprenyl-teichoic acid--peptidoglycan teichoic acid transferase